MVSDPWYLLNRLVAGARIDPNGCWIWSSLNKHGYGTIGVDGGSASSHRTAWILLVGPIPAGLHLDHLCRNRACLNPDHLEPVTNAENQRRKSYLYLRDEWHWPTPPDPSEDPIYLDFPEPPDPRVQPVYLQFDRPTRHARADTHRKEPPCPPSSRRPTPAIS